MEKLSELTEMIIKLSSDALIIGLILGLVELIKRTFNIDSKYAPITSLIVSLFVVTPIAIFYLNFAWYESVVASFGVALAASGLWSWGKKLLS